MKITLGNSNLESFFTKKIEFISGQKLFNCYQCGKCSSGCPMAESMDILPNRVIREIQLGNRPVLMSCQAVWFCSSCFGCTARCPKGLDIARIMEAIRILQILDRESSIKELTGKDADALPQIALISHFRKFSL